MTRLDLSVVLRYAVATVAVATAVGLIALFAPMVYAPTPLLIVSVVAAAWFSGLGPGLLAALLATLAMHTFEAADPRLFEPGMDDFLRSIALTLLAILVSSLTLQRQRAEEQLRRVNAELEARVASGTEELAQANAALQARYDELREAEAALARQGAILRSLLDAIPDPIS